MQIIKKVLLVLAVVLNMAAWVLFLVLCAPCAFILDHEFWNTFDINEIDGVAAVLDSTPARTYKEDKLIAGCGVLLSVPAESFSIEELAEFQRQANSKLAADSPYRYKVLISHRLNEAELVKMIPIRETARKTFEDVVFEHIGKEDDVNVERNFDIMLRNK